MGTICLYASGRVGYWGEWGEAKGRRGGKEGVKGFMGLSHCISYLDHITTRRRSWHGLSSRDDEMKFMQCFFLSQNVEAEFTITIVKYKYKKFLFKYHETF